MVWLGGNTSRADDAVISGWFCLLIFVCLDCPVYNLDIPMASWVLDKWLINDPIQRDAQILDFAEGLEQSLGQMKSTLSRSYVLLFHPTASIAARSWPSYVSSLYQQGPDSTTELIQPTPRSRGCSDSSVSKALQA